MAILGIDPGRNKFGVALFDRASKRIVYRKIVRFREFSKDPAGIGAAIAAPLAEAVKQSAAAGTIDAIALGDGTFGADYRAALSGIVEGREEYSKINIYIVGEKGTTEEGRAMYRRENPPRFPLSLLPSSLIPVLAEVDDYAAAAIAMRCPDARAAG